jgi:phosphonate transport system substrate-binding protein
MVIAAGAMAQSDLPNAPIEVRPGDTLSSLAAPLVGGARHWSKLYDPERTGLPDPNLILPGMRFELITEASGRRYLRLMTGDARNAARAAPPAQPQAAAVPAAPAARAAPAAPPVPAVPAVPSIPPLAAAAGEQKTLVLGVLPFISAATLMNQYDSLKAYLEREGGQKVRIVLPESFKAFFDSTMRGDYDIAIAAPHFARVAQLDGRMVPLALYEPRIPAQFVTTREATLATPAEVRGKAVAFANPTSLVAMYGQLWLSAQSLEGGKDYEVKSARTDMGVGRMLLTGEAAAVVMSGGEFRALPAEESSRLKVVEVFARIPNFIVMAHPRLGSERQAQIKSRLLGFLADKSDGAAFAKATGLSGIVEVDDATLRELDPYVALTRRVMGGGN